MIKQNLEKILSKLPSGVQLVAVSKFHPVECLLEAYQAGQRIFAESRPQEFAAKVPQMPADVQWHFIGHLQTNKLKLVLPYVSLVQSVDSLHLLEAIDNWAVANQKVIDILLELHLGAEETKQGFTEEDILSVCRSLNVISSQVPKNTLACDAIAHRSLFVVAGQEKNEDLRRFQGIRLRGLMGMASNTDDLTQIEAEFARIHTLFLKIRTVYPDLEVFDQLSIGMSGDWPIAVKHGATMVRIGTDIFGPREY